MTRTLESAVEALALGPAWETSLLRGLGGGFDGLPSIGAGSLIAQDVAPNPFGTLFFPMMVIMLLAYFIMIRPQQQKQRKYDEMIASLKENDRVITTGGLHGVVTSVQRDAERVTLRLDDATGAKVKVSMWAISHMAADDKPVEKAGGEKADNPGGAGKSKAAANAGKK